MKDSEKIKKIKEIFYYYSHQTEKDWNMDLIALCQEVDKIVHK